MRNLIFFVIGLLGVGLVYISFTLTGSVENVPAMTPVPKAAKASGPNVVFILVDTVRADRYYGQRNGLPIMPKLNALAAKGRSFTQAISPASHTRAAVASLFTGQYVDTHGVYFGATSSKAGGATSSSIPEAWPTLAEALRDAGYLNYAFITNGNVQKLAGYAQGYSDEEWVYESAAQAERVTNAALERVKSIKEPFALYLHYLDPHAEYYPPEPYRNLFGPLPELTESDKDILKPERQIPYIMVHVDKMFGRKAAEDGPALSDAGKETMQIWYDGECRYIDDEVSRLVETLQAQHPNTLFVFTSDHGEEFWEHRGMGHGTTVYQEQIHVPLFFVGPKVAPEVVDTTVCTVGIYKTLAAYLGLTPSIPPRGEDLLGPQLAGLAYSRTRGASTDYEVDFEAVVEGMWKGIRDGKAAQTQTYDLGADPSELSPLAEAAQSDKADQLLDTHRKENAAARPSRIKAEEVPLTPEQRQNMKILGYMNDEEKK